MVNLFTKWIRLLLILIYLVYWDQLFINIYLSAYFVDKPIMYNVPGFNVQGDAVILVSNGH